MTAASSTSVRPLVAGDAPRLVQCFERCYGDTYVTPTFYDPVAIAARINAGELRSVVAVDEEGDIVGHMGLTLRHRAALTADAGNTIVDPRFRNQKLAARLGAGIFELCRDAGLVGFHHYATTAHPIMQKLAVQGGGIETGIMLDYVPAGTHYRDLATTAEAERAAAIIIYHPITAAPERQVFLPPPYEAAAVRMYERARLVRRPQAPPATAPARTTALERTRDASRGMLRLEITRVGSDLTSRLDDALATTETDLLQMDLPLGDPSTGDATNALRGRGFFFCAILPEYRDGDVLRLQRLPRAAGSRTLPDLVTAEARNLLAFIGRDQATVATLRA